MKLRGGQRQGAAGIADLDEGNAFRQRRRRHALGHDRRGTGGERLGDETQPVVPAACHRHEQVAGLDGAAVGADAGDVEGGEARIDDGIHGNEIGELHGGSRRIVRISSTELTVATGNSPRFIRSSWRRAHPRPRSCRSSE